MSSADSYSRQRPANPSSGGMPKHRQHAEDKPETADREPCGQAALLVECAGLFRRAQADEQQRFGERVRASREQRAFSAQLRGAGHAKQQEARVFNRRENQQALQAPL